MSVIEIKDVIRHRFEKDGVVSHLALAVDVGSVVGINQSQVLEKSIFASRDKEPEEIVLSLNPGLGKRWVDNLIQDSGVNFRHIKGKARISTIEGLDDSSINTQITSVLNQLFSTEMLSQIPTYNLEGINLALPRLDIFYPDKSLFLAMAIKRDEEGFKYVDRASLIDSKVRKVLIACLRDGYVDVCSYSRRYPNEKPPFRIGKNYIPKINSLLGIEIATKPTTNNYVEACVPKGNERGRIEYIKRELVRSGINLAFIASEQNEARLLAKKVRNVLTTVFDESRSPVCNFLYMPISDAVGKLGVSIRESVQYPYLVLIQGLKYGVGGKLPLAVLEATESWVDILNLWNPVNKSSYAGLTLVNNISHFNPKEREKLIKQFSRFCSKLKKDNNVFLASDKLNRGRFSTVSLIFPVPEASV